MVRGTTATGGAQGCVVHLVGVAARFGRLGVESMPQRTHHEQQAATDLKAGSEMPKNSNQVHTQQALVAMTVNQRCMRDPNHAGAVWHPARGCR